MTIIGIFLALAMVAGPSAPDKSYPPEGPKGANGCEEPPKQK